MDFHVLVEYLFSNHVDEFCKSRLRKCFDGFAEGFHVVTKNHGGEWPNGLDKFMGHPVEKVWGKSLLRGMSGVGRESRILELGGVWFLLLCLWLPARILHLTVRQTFCLPEKGRHFL